MTNLAYTYVQAIGKDIKGCREEFDGACIDFAGDFQEWLGRGRLMYFDGIGDPRWRYHAALEVDGIIHDLWHDEPMPAAEFLELLGGGIVDCPSEEMESEWAL